MAVSWEADLSHLLSDFRDWVRDTAVEPEDRERSLVLPLWDRVVNGDGRVPAAEGREELLLLAIQPAPRLLSPPRRSASVSQFAI